jgi:hypothetical protein
MSAPRRLLLGYANLNNPVVTKYGKTLDDPVMIFESAIDVCWTRNVSSMFTLARVYARSHGVRLQAALHRGCVQWNERPVHTAHVADIECVPVDDANERDALLTGYSTLRYDDRAMRFGFRAGALVTSAEIRNGNVVGRHEDGGAAAQ